MDKTSVSAILWLCDDAERMNTLRELRNTMTVGERARLNSPITARQRVEKVLKVRTGNGGLPRQRPSPIARYTNMIADRNDTIAHLQEQLAAAEARDGSLFDLNKDTVEDIVKVFVANCSKSKAERIAKGILEALKKPKPAG